MHRHHALPLLVALVCAASLAVATVPAHAARAARPYDFDGNGRPELAVGAPGLEVHGHTNAGGVVVYPSSRLRDGEIFTQSTRRLVGASEDSDEFGASLASADFDRDGYADLAIGQPGEALASTGAAGAVTILAGTRQGLTARGSSRISTPGEALADAYFGASLAAGDLNGDGYPDLAVGAPGDDPKRQDADYPASGTVSVFFGSKGGLTTIGSRLLRRVPGAVEDGGFGFALAVADVDADDQADLVVLAPGRAEEDGESLNSAVSYCPGAPPGPTSCRRLLSGEGGTRALVLGNVQGDVRPEIVLGVPSDSDEDVASLTVLVLSGSGAATSARRVRLVRPDLGLGTVEDEYLGGGDLGWSLAAAEVDGDGYDDLVVGAPTGIAGDRRAGRVALVHGGPGGLASTGNRWLDQDDPGVPGSPETGDRFGHAVALLDLTGDGSPELIVGVPGENEQVGRVTTFRGTRGGPATTSSRTSGWPEPQGHDPFPTRFGAALGR